MVQKQGGRSAQVTQQPPHPVLNLHSQGFLLITQLCGGPLGESQGPLQCGLLEGRGHASFILVSLVPGAVSGTDTHHQCADLDLLIFGGLVDLFEQGHAIGDDEGGTAELGGRVDESLHGHQLVYVALRATQGYHHLHHTFQPQQLIA